MAVEGMCTLCTDTKHFNSCWGCTFWEKNQQPNSDGVRQEFKKEGPPRIPKRRFLTFQQSLLYLFWSKTERNKGFFSPQESKNSGLSS